MPPQSSEKTIWRRIFLSKAVCLTGENRGHTILIQWLLISLRFFKNGKAGNVFLPTIEELVETMLTRNRRTVG